MALPKNRSHDHIQWKIWYHDPESPEYCRTWSNQDGKAIDSPVGGVVCIVQTADQGRSKDIVSGADHYAIDEEGKWIGMDAAGVADRRENNLHFHALKKGRWINTDRYQEIMSRAHNDPDFGGLGRPVLMEEVNFLVNKPIQHPGDN